jgi:hypothetical protein
VLKIRMLKRLRNRLRAQRDHLSYIAAVRGRAANLNSIKERLKTAHHAVRCPLIMVSQVERSGGSLMAQLFDGHPELLAHPQELKIGHPEKEIWPRTDHSDLDEQFRILFEPRMVEFCETGYAKGRHNEDRKNFHFVPYVQREVFREVLKKTNGSSSREILDAYFTSYFNAWLNMRSRIDQAKFVTGFVPMMAVQERNMDEFWRIYPDGFLISIIRSPLSWYPSFLKEKEERGSFFKQKAGRTLSKVEISAARWIESTRAMFREHERRKDQVIVLNFDDLVGNTEATMRLVCRRVGLGYHPLLISPTFNWEPIRSNSIFGATEAGVVTSAPAQRDTLLNDAERDYLTTHCMPLYEKALREIAEPV